MRRHLSEHPRWSGASFSIFESIFGKLPISPYLTTFCLIFILELNKSTK